MKPRARSLLKVLVSLGVGAGCTFLVVRDLDRAAVVGAFHRVSLATVALYLVTMAATHLFRALRWHHLLQAIGVRVARGQLLAISSVGFLAILALPFRLGELVRPYYVVRQGHSRMSAVLGTVAVERVVDGLVVSCLLVLSYALAPHSFARPVEALGGLPLRYFAWLSLAVFTGATAFLVVALGFHAPAIRVGLRWSGLSRFAPAPAARLADRLTALVHGFRSLRQPRNLLPFLLQTILYWGCNAGGMWLLAEGIGLPIGPVGAVAVMAFTGVVISLPNSPGLIGQFHLGVVAVFAAFLSGSGGAGAASAALGYAILLHALQTLWYLAAGLVGLRAVSGDRARDVAPATARTTTADPEAA